MHMGRILIKGGAVVTMERRIPDLPAGDVLIENDRGRCSCNIRTSKATTSTSFAKPARR
jgi:hypothetical protein